MVWVAVVGQPGATSSRSTPSPHTPQQQLGQTVSPSERAGKKGPFRIRTRACVCAYLSYSGHYGTYYNVIHLPLNLCAMGWKSMKVQFHRDYSCWHLKT